MAHENRYELQLYRARRARHMSTIWTSMDAPCHAAACLGPPGLDRPWPRRSVLGALDVSPRASNDRFDDAVPARCGSALHGRRPFRVGTILYPP